MFCYNNNLLLPLQLNLFVTNGQIYCYGTRTANKYRKHLCCTNLTQFIIFYPGPKIWNSLPLSITRSSNLFSFERKCKSFLRASTYSTSASSPSINYNAVNKNFCALKRQINDDDDGGVTKKEQKFT